MRAIKKYASVFRSTKRWADLSATATLQAPHGKTRKAGQEGSGRAYTRSWTTTTLMLPHWKTRKAWREDRDRASTRSWTTNTLMLVLPHWKTRKAWREDSRRASTRSWTTTILMLPHWKTRKAWREDRGRASTRTEVEPPIHWCYLIERRERLGGRIEVRLPIRSWTTTTLMFVFPHWKTRKAWREDKGRASTRSWTTTTATLQYSHLIERRERQGGRIAVGLPPEVEPPPPLLWHYTTVTSLKDEKGWSGG